MNGSLILSVILRLVVATVLAAGIVVVMFLGAAVGGSSAAFESAPFFLAVAMLPIAWAMWPVFTYSRRSAIITTVGWLVAGLGGLALVRGPLGQACLQAWFSMTVLIAIWSGFRRPTVLQTIEANEDRRKATQDGR